MSKNDATKTEATVQVLPLMPDKSQGGMVLLLSGDDDVWFQPDQPLWCKSLGDVQFSEDADSPPADDEPMEVGFGGGPKPANRKLMLYVF